MRLAHSRGHFTLFTAAEREIAPRDGVRTVLECVGTRRDQRHRGEPHPGGPDARVDSAAGLLTVCGETFPNATSEAKPVRCLPGGTLRT